MAKKPGNTLPAFDRRAVEAIIGQCKAMPGAMLPILHGVQDRVGYIPPETVQLIADALNVSRAEVHGVITYYHFFRQTPPGRHVVQICRAEACQAVGGEALAVHAKAVLGCDFHETTTDGKFTLEAVYCLGQCACGPAVMFGNDLHARVSSGKFDRLLDEKRSTP
ncbi:MAG TPA: formate dehydrogenase subunit gamma [Rhodoferax sp.]|nr:formate dehydrogenase subunit gamma [Rhodoferax sp.]